jgi:hypothetical protein
MVLKSNEALQINGHRSFKQLEFSMLFQQQTWATKY